MMMYGHVVAQISLGAQLNQTVKAIQEAEAYPGPSLIIAYSPCEEHGYDLALSHDQMRQLTATGFWPLYRFDPRRADEGKIRWRWTLAHRQTRWLRRCSMSNASVA
jgi:pyruvate/2-oxoacid:ferredoxin oxidoreductase beta subunit